MCIGWLSGGFRARSSGDERGIFIHFLKKGMLFLESYMYFPYTSHDVEVLLLGKEFQNEDLLE